MYNVLPTYRKVGLIASIIATVLLGGGLILTLAVPETGNKHTVIGMIVSFLMSVGWIGSLVSYVTGGFIESLKCALSIAKWGWILMPFPINFLTGFVTTIIALLVVFCFPIIPVIKSCRNYLENHIIVDDCMY